MDPILLSLIIDFGNYFFKGLYSTIRIATERKYFDGKNPLKEPTIFLHENQKFKMLLIKELSATLLFVCRSHKIKYASVIVVSEDFESRLTQPDWRSKSDCSYKRKKRNKGIKSVDIRSLSRYVRENIFDKLKILFLSSPGNEADDMIYLLYRLVLESKSTNSILVLSEDSDFSQLVDNKCRMINRFGIEIDYHPSSKVNLYRKIIGGDKSDNIGPCFFSATMINAYKNAFFINNPEEIIFGKIFSRNQHKIIYHKIDDKTIKTIYYSIDYKTTKKIIISSEQVRWILNYLDMHPIDIYNRDPSISQIISNQRLIDFSKIPDNNLIKLTNVIIDRIEKYIVKHGNEQFDLSNSIIKSLYNYCNYKLKSIAFQYEECTMVDCDNSSDLSIEVV